MSLELNWKYICKLSELLDKQNDLSEWSVPGVYLWVENVNDTNRSFKKKCVNYVGKSKSSLLKRNIYHHVQQVVCLYSVPDLYRNENRRYIPGKDNYAVLKSVKNFSDLRIESEEYMKNVDLYFCRVESDKLKEIESDLLFQMIPLETNHSTRSASSLKFEFTHNCDDEADLVEFARNGLSYIDLLGGRNKGEEYIRPFQVGFSDHYKNIYSSMLKI